MFHREGIQSDRMFHVGGGGIQLEDWYVQRKRSTIRRPLYVSRIESVPSIIITTVRKAGEDDDGIIF